MGSIQVFPKRSRAGTLADVWRSVPIAGRSALVAVRAALPEDFALLHGLHRRAHPDRPAIAMKVLESQRQQFPEGQLVAECGGALVGSASSLVIDWNRHAPRREALTAQGSFANHDPGADTLLAAGMCVDASRRCSGVQRSLLQAQRQLCRRLNLRRIVAAASLTGYAAQALSCPPELFAARIVMGDIAHAHMRFHLAHGFQFFGLARDYDPSDLASGGHAALLVWLNPHYTPPAPPAREQGDGIRKCA